MKFEWDEAKRQSNIRKHGVDFADLEPLFNGITVTTLDDRFNYGEDRLATFGLLNSKYWRLSILKPTRSSESFPLEEQPDMKKRVTSKKSQTDLKRLKAMKDEDINLSDNPELTPEMFARAIVRQGLKPVVRKAQMTLRLDQDVLEWFRQQGRGYQTHINALLRAYMEAHKRDAT